MRRFSRVLAFFACAFVSRVYMVFCRVCAFGCVTCTCAFVCVCYVYYYFFSLGNIGTAQPWWLGFWYHTLSEKCITIFFFLRTSEYFSGKPQRRPFVFYIIILSVCEKEHPVVLYIHSSCAFPNNTISSSHLGNTDWYCFPFPSF